MPLYIPLLPTLAGYLQFRLPHCRPSHMLTCHAWALCTFFSARSVLFFPAVLINFRFVQVLLSLPPAAAAVAVAGCRSCCCVWHAFNAGLRQPTSTLGGQATRNWDAAASVSMSTLPGRASLSLCALHCVMPFLRLLNGAEIAESFKKNCMQCARQFAGMPGLSNGCSSWSIWTHIKRNKRVLYFVAYFRARRRISALCPLSCIPLPTFKRLLKTPAATANRSANSWHILQHLQATFCLWLVLISPCTLPACCQLVVFINALRQSRLWLSRLPPQMSLSPSSSWLCLPRPKRHK